METSHGPWAITALLLILLLGFGLRVHELERQSMWTDEGLSLYRARLPLNEVLANTIVIDSLETRDTNPPLYFLLLHLWRNLSGESMTALRFTGSAAGFLAIPLIYVLGALLYDRRVGLAAALLLAISPIHVWHSQVLRNYSLLVTLNLFSIYGLFRYLSIFGQGWDSSEGKKSSLQTQGWRWLLLWAGAGLLGIYTHYFGLLVFAFGLLALIILVGQRWGLRQRRFWVAMVMILLLSIPALLIAVDRFQAGQQFDFFFVPLAAVLQHAFSAFSVGVIQTLIHPWWRLWPALILILLGILLGLRRNLPGTLLLLGYQIIPLGLLLLISVVNPLYNGVRHLLIGLPPFLLLMANGITGPGLISSERRPAWLPLAVRSLRLLLGIAAIFIQVSWLNLQFTDESLLRDDIRGAAVYLNQMAGPDDMIILHDAIIGFVFDYYYDGAAPWQAIPQYGQQDLETAVAELAAAGESAQRIWFLTHPTPRTGFPTRPLRDWADANWPRFFEQGYPSLLLPVRLNGYTPNPTNPTLPEGLVASETTFGDVLHLEGLEIPETVNAGDPWWRTWYWSTLTDVVGEYELSLRWLDEDGELWWQTEDLLWDDYPPSAWEEGAIVRFDQPAKTPAGLPPGKYALALRILDEASQELLTAEGANEIYLGDITVTGAARDLASLPSLSTQNARLGPVDLLGYRLPESAIKPGHEIPLTFLWRVREKPAADYQLQIQLLDAEGMVIGETSSPPTRRDFPATAWQVGDTFLGKASSAVPAAASGEPLGVQISLVDPETGQAAGQAVILEEQLAVSPWPLVTDLPDVERRTAASFGDPSFVALHGYDLAAEDIPAGDVLDLTLVWQAALDVDESWMTFIHIEDGDGRIVAQQDSLPVGGLRPTSSWREKEVIVDQHLISIGPEVAPGTYEMWLGFYIPETGERPVAVEEGLLRPDGRLRLGEIQIIAKD